ncbi:GerAB/ArcD/ProY family transporter [Paramaledivibacter caminithermalis]|jgi:spore germination protein|uniref:Spore germination protein n=1 Tax=Paramaledivibacter caminithermalis (strain DSM 15212 / CIP 107654 / DViRD3) TaxID=1121301 RepID=A0A1M6KGZ1_PARC5|nr:endospore germination permease [Paramaledivibacter caminithermalis]SHJ58199.1 spore germination protein [Paramaledivibacter caminithermalis DSM 15212]
MDRNNDVIMSSQLYSILVTTVIGIGILSMPRALAENVGPDSLIVLVLGSVLFLIIALLIQRLVTKFPNKTIIEMSANVLFKPMGTIIGFGYFLHLLISTVLVVRAFGEITKNFLLLNTPIEVIIISFLITVVYSVRSGIESIARLAVIILPMSIFPALFVMLVAIPDLDFTYFLPILKTPLPKIIKTVPQIFFSFIGFEIILQLGFFVKDRKNIKKAAIKSILFISSVYFVFTAITIARFGIAETKILTWPVVTLFKSVDVPGTLLENVEAVIMATWLLSIFMSVAVSYYVATFLLSRILKSKEHNYLALFILPLVYILSLIPKNIVEVYEFLDKFANIVSITMIFIIPIFLLFISFLKRKSKKGMKRNG